MKHQAGTVPILRGTRDEFISYQQQGGIDVLDQYIDVDVLGQMLEQMNACISASESLSSYFRGAPELIETITNALRNSMTTSVEEYQELLDRAAAKLRRECGSGDALLEAWSELPEGWVTPDAHIEDSVLKTAAYDLDLYVRHYIDGLVGRRIDMELVVR